MRIALAGIALAALVAVPSLACAAAETFTDNVCEKATPLGRHLDELVAKNDTLTPELMAGAIAMRDVYEACLTGYDRDATSNTGHGGEQYGSSNGAIVGRLYSRLALARALQRVAEYDRYDKHFDDAAAALSEANRRLDEMEHIVPLGDTHPGTPERTLLTRARDFRATLSASAAQLAAQKGTTTGTAATPSLSAPPGGNAPATPAPTSKTHPT